MRAIHPSVLVAGLTVLLAGCAVAQVTARPSTAAGAPTTASEAPSHAVASSPSFQVPASTPGVTTSGTSPTPIADASPQPRPSGPDGFVTSVTIDGATAWTGIHWQKIDAADPLGHVRSVTHWPGGYVALGDLEPADGSAHTRIWVSADGRRWDALKPNALDSRAVVVGMAATADGLVAMTLQSGTVICEDAGPHDLSLLDCWTKTGPLQSWTSSDGTAWTAHPGPAITLPEMEGQGEATPTLVGATSDHLIALTLAGQPLAVTRDGIAWGSVPRDAFPADWRAERTVASPAGLVAVGNAGGKTVAVSSADGRTWASHAFRTIATPIEDLVSGSDGLIMTGLDYPASGPPTWVWWSSLDGRYWRALPGYPPLSAMSGSAAQECRNTCPDGSLGGNGERMIAYRGWRTQVGWTSFDGRSWLPLRFEGRPETSSGWLDDHCTNDLVVTAIGVSCTDSDGATWFGTAQT